ncbi:hypothetical protein ABMB67_002325 [Halalkalibacter oceani]
MCLLRHPAFFIKILGRLPHVTVKKTELTTLVEDVMLNSTKVV